MKKLVLLTCFVSLMLSIGVVNAGSVVHGYAGSNICQNPATDTFITFENGVDRTPITNQYPGVVFSTAVPAYWQYGDVSTGTWSYPLYWTNGNFLAHLANTGDTPGAIGRIDITDGASYVSLLIANQLANPWDAVTLDAYDASNNLIDSAGPTTDNTNTNTMDQLTVSHSGIKYVLVHNSVSGNPGLWSMDDVCIGSERSINPVATPEFPSTTLPAIMIVGLLGAVLLIKRTGEH